MGSTCTCCRDASGSTYIRSSIPRPILGVRHGRSLAKVRLAALNVLRREGRRLVSLVDVWWAAGLATDPAKLRIDLVGDDGFQTALKGGPALAGSALEAGVVDLDTRDVSWAIDVPCFYRVKGLVEIVARIRVPAYSDFR
jgi:hypothetical protein